MRSLIRLGSSAFNIRREFLPNYYFIPTPPLTMSSSERLSSASACRLSCAEVLAALSVDSRHGLSAADVFQHHRTYGKNELDEAPDDPLWKKYLDKLKEPMIALLLASAVVSTLMAQYDDAISIAIVRCGPRAARTPRARC